MSYRKWIYIGVALFALGIGLGLLGTFWGISSSFASLETAELTGLGPVNSGLKTAMMSTIFRLVGAVIGSLLIVIGAVKAYRSK